MSSNPYQPPNDSRAIGRINPVASPQETLEIANAHQGLMWLAAGRLALDVTWGMALQSTEPTVIYGYATLGLVVLAACAFFAFRLANAIYGVGPGLLCAMLMFLPCMGLMTILILGGNAIDLLRKRGVKVGMMGATKQQVREIENAIEMQHE